MTASQLEAQLSALRQKKDLIESDTRPLRAQFKELKGKLRAKKNERSAIERDIEEALKARLRNLASEMYTKLPRELRDLVYTMACVDEEALIVHYWERSRSKAGGAIDSRRKTNYGYPEFDLYDDDLYIDNTYTGDHGLESDRVFDRYLLDPDYVGANVAREAAEIYYSKNKFTIMFDRVFRDFLSRDVFGIGVQPYALVRKLIVAIRCESLNSYSFDDGDGADETALAFLDAKVANIKRGFSLITDKTRLELDFTIYTGFEGESPCGNAQRCFYNILEAIWMPIMDMKRDGSKIAVNHYDHYCSHLGISKLFEQATFERRQRLKAELWDHNQIYLSRKEKDMMGSKFKVLLERRWGVDHFEFAPRDHDLFSEEDMDDDDMDDDDTDDDDDDDDDMEV